MSVMTRSLTPQWKILVNWFDAQTLLRISWDCLLEQNLHVLDLSHGRAKLPTLALQLGMALDAVVKAEGIFLLPRIFPSYFMKILQQVFRKNVLRNISWHFSKCNSNFSKLPHSMIYDERFWDLTGRLSAGIVLPFLLDNRNVDISIVQRLWYLPPIQEVGGSNPSHDDIFISVIIPRNIPKYILNN